MLKRTTILTAAASTGLLFGAMALPAVADIRHDAVVAENPLDSTPHVLDGVVNAIAVVGDTVVVGGKFTQVRNSASGSPVQSRINIFSYNKKTGQIDSGFAPEVDGEVATLEAGMDGTVYVGGLFGLINGESARRLALLNVADGTRNQTFAQSEINWGKVNVIVRRGNNLYVGGRFDAITDNVTGEQRHNLAKLNAVTGAIDPNFDIVISNPRRGELMVKDLAVDPNDAKLIIDGTFTTVNGERRYQIAMIDLGETATLSTWETDMYGNTCDPEYDTYMRGIDFSPDGSYFVVVTTGGAGYGPVGLCTSAARWEADRTGPVQQPTWANYTGGDTLMSVAVTGAAVYVGGHQRWMDNRLGYENPAPGSVSREGIAAIDPTTGKSADVPWNPTRTRGEGAGVLTATADGLLVGSDTDQLGGEFHGRIGEFPLP
ncbi:hypothetical protein ACFHW2_11710 [Actinomadura sp. LOL_016]|uniref:hypothetical protein n=1 Tax=unclassified Actinomadura TaxID=2626254 RepID=UPI003A810B00